jgi:NADH-quinone oxidoreductase subunit I
MSLADKIRSNPLYSLKMHAAAIATGLKYLVARPRMTVRYPEFLMEPTRNYRGMIRLHKDKCISCSLCAQVCPAASMKMYKLPGEKKMYPGINYQRCIFCGFCVDICPVNALEHTPVHDIADEEMEGMILLPMPGGFDREWKSPAEKEGARRVKIVFDEEEGLKHEPE